MNIEKKFDPSKPVQTRDGRKARIICTDKEGNMPIVALLLVDDGEEVVREYCSSGNYYYFDNSVKHRDDLVNTNVERETQ